MKNDVLKGSIAAVAAAALLLGGAGTLAYWSDEGSLPGADIESGELRLGEPVCGDWQLDGGAAYTTQLLVPRDSLSRTCRLDLVATGDHLVADLAIGTPAWASENALTDELDPQAVFTVNGAPATTISAADDTGEGEIEAVITVDFPGGPATNDSQALSATLDAVVVSAVQDHDAA